MPEKSKSIVGGDVQGARRRAVAKARARGRLAVTDRIPMPRDEGTPWGEGAKWPQCLRSSRGRYTPPSILTGSRMNGG